MESDEKDIDGGLVEESIACPACGERRADWLVWQDDDWVRCDSCGRTYQP